MPGAREEWRPIPGYEGLYDVSNEGNVRGVKRRKILKSRASRTGYLQLQLHADGQAHHVSVHRLVASAFIGPVPHGCEVNHVDGNKANNTVANLAYVSHSENIRHANREGLRAPAVGRTYPQAKLTPDSVRAIRALRGQMTTRELAARFGVSQPLICMVLNRKRWAHVR